MPNDSAQFPRDSDFIGLLQMKWQDIIFTPLFWIVSIIGTVVLSIVGNLLTPWVSAFVTRNLHARKSGLRKKQIQRRDKVVTLQANVSRRTGVKLDGIFKLLLATFMQLLVLFFFSSVPAGFISRRPTSLRL